MSFIKDVFNKLMGKDDSSKVNLSTYQGLASLYQTDILGTKKKCRFVECMVNFISGDKPFSYVIFVQNLQPVDDKELEYYFPISKEMDLSWFILDLIIFALVIITQKTTFPQFLNGYLIQSTFIITLSNKNLRIKLQLEFDKDQKNDACEFQEIICKLIYENYYQKSCIVQKSEEYLCFCKQINMSEKQEKLVQPQQSSELSDLAKEFEKNLNLIPKLQEPVEEQKYQYPEINQNMEEKIQAMLLKQSSLSNTLYTASGKYLILDDFGELKQCIPSDIIIILEDKGDFHYRMRVINSDGVEIQTILINQDFNFGISITEGIFKWVQSDSNGIKCFAMKAEKESAIIDLKFFVEKCQFQSSRKMQISEVIKKQDENLYQERQFKQNEQYTKEIIEDCNSFIEDEEIQDTCKSLNSGKQEENNNALVQANILDRTFVSRGSIIDVFHTATDNWEQLNVFSYLSIYFSKHICSLPPVKTYEGDQFTPKKLIMYQDDSKLIMLDTILRKQAYILDLEKGSIFQELKIDGQNSIKDITPETKHGDLNDNNFFIAMNQKNLFKLDARIEKSSIQSKIYAKIYNFSSLTTNNDKNIILGSESGEIRLFDEVGKNAKNMFVGMGDPIFFMDTTKDGKWILATCKSYIIFLPAIYGNYNAYKKVIKYEERQIPRKLTLSPNDIAKYKIKNVEFTPARFDDSKEAKEQFFTTSVENYLIIWNVKKVIQGKLFDYQVQLHSNYIIYQIKQISNNKIVNSQYKFDSNSNLLIETLNELKIQKFKNK